MPIMLVTYNTSRIIRLSDSRAVDGHQMYSGGSVVGKASTIGPEFSPSPPIIFNNLVSFSPSLKFEPPAFENAARYPNSETKMQCSDDRPMFSPSLMKLVHAPLRKLCQFCATP